MKKEEIEFVEKSLIELAKANESVTISEIINYLDYINKVCYTENDIKPILNHLIKQNKIIHNNDKYIYLSLK